MSGVDDLLGEMARLTIEHVGRPEGPHDRSMSALTRHDLVVLCDAVIAFRARARAAEQRAEAAEAERDRMRVVVEAVGEWRAWPEHSKRIDALVTAIDAYRAGQPATPEAEQIAAWLIREESDDTSRGQFACFIADRIRAGAWRKP